MINQRTILQFVGYLCVGTCATGVHITTLYLLVEKLLINPIVASSVGFIAGATTGFLLNRNFVFKTPTISQQQRSGIKSIGSAEYVKYCAMAGAGAVINGSLLAFLLYHCMLNYIYAQLLATASIVILNFICCKLWIFKACPKDN